MFEAIHGSAPDIAGKGVANPSGLLMAAIQMLVHLGLGSYAEKIKNAWLCTLEDGIHTADIYRVGLSEREVGTAGFTDAVIERLDRAPCQLQPVQYQNHPIQVKIRPPKPQKKELVGVDVFLDWTESDRNPDVLGQKLEAFDEGELKLVMITNRGVKVYPEGLPETFLSDRWRCRFESSEPITFRQILALLERLDQAGLDVIKTEHLYLFDGELGYSLGQGQ